MTRVASGVARTVTDRAVVVPTARWIALTGGSYGLGLAGRVVGVPAPHMVAGLLIGAVVALCGLVSERLPRKAYRWVQLLVGVMMGSYMDLSALRGSAGDVLPLTTVTAATVVLSILVASWLSRRDALDRPTATLSMVPGAASAMTVAADSLDVDVRVVAVGQYLRLGLVALVTPFVALELVAQPAGRDRSGHALVVGLTHFVDSPNQLAGVATMVVIAILGNQFGHRMALPAPAVLGPMLLAAAAVSVGAASGFAPRGILEDLVFTLVGLEVGLRFTRSSLARLSGQLPRLLVGSVLVCLGCAVLAAALALLTGMPLLDAYLATTPGGIYLVIPVAVALHANIALVSTVQSLRLFVVVLLAPPLVRWTLRGRAPAAPPAHVTSGTSGGQTTPTAMSAAAGPSPADAGTPATEPAPALTSSAAD